MKLIPVLVMMLFSVPAMANPDDPRSPEIDSVNLGRAKAGQTTRRAVLKRAGHEDLTLEIVIEGEQIDFVACVSGKTRRIETVKIKEIRFSRWEGVQVKNNQYRYSPGEAILLLDDGTTFCSRSVPALRMFRTAQGNFYSFFFKTLKVGEKKIILKEPLDGTVLEIRFIETGNVLPFWPFPGMKGP